MAIISPLASNAVTATTPIIATPAIDQTAATTTLNALIPTASTVDLSPVAEFLSSAGLSRRSLQALQGDTTSTANEQAATLVQATTDAQNLVTAFNTLQATTIDTAPLPFDASSAETPAEQLVQSLQAQQTQQAQQAQQAEQAQQAQQTADAQRARQIEQQADNTVDPNNLIALPQIGINVQASPLNNQVASLTLDAPTLQNALATDPTGTLSLLSQTADAFSRLGTNLAQQLSDAATVQSTADQVQANITAINVANQQAADNAEQAAANAAAGLPQNSLSDLSLGDLVANQQAQLAAQQTTEATQNTLLAANQTQAQLDATNLADLQQTNLQQAALQQAALQQANLQQANLLQANQIAAADQAQQLQTNQDQARQLQTTTDARVAQVTQAQQTSAQTTLDPARLAQATAQANLETDLAQANLSQSNLAQQNAIQADQQLAGLEQLNASQAALNVPQNANVVPLPTAAETAQASAAQANAGQLTAAQQAAASNVNASLAAPQAQDPGTAAAIAAYRLSAGPQIGATNSANGGQRSSVPPVAAVTPVTPDQAI